MSENFKTEKEVMDYIKKVKQKIKDKKKEITFLRERGLKIMAKRLEAK